MQWLIILIAVLTAIPTFGISIIVLIVILPYLSAKTRRDMMPKVILNALMAGGSYNENNIYYEAAEKYAKDSNNIISESFNNISFYELIGGEKIYVTFSKAFNGSVNIYASYDA